MDALPDPAFLGSIALFGGLSGESLERIAQRLRPRELAAGSEVLTEGELAREMFVVEHGEVEVLVRRPQRDGELALAVLRRGACFGEMSLLDVQPRSATVRTRVPSSLLVLGYRDLLAIQTVDPEAFTMLMMNIAREVSRRLRLANHVLMDLLFSMGDTQRITQELFGGPPCTPADVQLKA